MAAFRNHPVATSSTIEEGVYVAPEAVIASPCVIRSGAQVCGRSVIGSGCIIENGAQIFNSDVGENCHIQRGARITLAGMGRNCQLHAGASIYHNSTLGDNVEVGAGACIGERVYIGDGCRISSGVQVPDSSSIPAGTNVTEDYYGGRNAQVDDALPLVPVAVIVADPVAAIPQDRRASLDDAARRQLMELHNRAMFGRQEIDAELAQYRDRMVQSMHVNEQRYYQNLQDISRAELISLVQMSVIVCVIMVILITSMDIYAVSMNLLRAANGICPSIKIDMLRLDAEGYPYAVKALCSSLFYFVQTLLESAFEVSLSPFCGWWCCINSFFGVFAHATAPTPLVL